MSKLIKFPESVSNIFVETSRAKAAFERLDDLMAQGWERTFCRALLLLGPARCGKTHIHEEWVRRKKEANPAFRAVVSEVPDSCNLPRMIWKLLEDLGDPDPSYGNSIEQNRRITELAAGANVIILDEVQRLVDAQTGKVIKHVAAWLTALQNRRICPVVLSGESYSVMVFEGVKYAEGRMLGQVDVNPYDWRTENLEFRVFLQQLDTQLGLPAPSGLGTPDTALRLHMFSEGRIGLVANVISEARALAVKRGGDNISMEDLAMASDRGRIGAARNLPNPFRVTTPVPGGTAERVKVDPPTSTKPGRFKARK